MITAKQKADLIKIAGAQGLSTNEINALVRAADKRATEIDVARREASVVQAQGDAEIQRIQDADNRSFGRRAATLADNALDGLTFGNSAEIRAGLSEIGERVGLQDRVDFADRVAQNEARSDELSVANPATAFTGEVAGSVAPFLLAAAGGLGRAALGATGLRAAAPAAATTAARAAPIARSLLDTSLRSGAVGATGGFVSDDEVIGNDGDFVNLPRRLRNTAVGGGLGLALPVGLAGGIGALRKGVGGAARFLGFGSKEVTDNFVKNANAFTEAANDPDIITNRSQQIATDLKNVQIQKNRVVNNKIGKEIESRPEVDISDTLKDVEKLRAKLKKASKFNDQGGLDAKANLKALDRITNRSRVEVVEEVITPARPSVGIEATTRQVEKVRKTKLPDVVSGREARKLKEQLETFRVNRDSITVSGTEKNTAAQANKIAQGLGEKTIGPDLNREFQGVKNDELNLKKIIGNFTKQGKTTTQIEGAKLENFFEKARGNRAAPKSEIRRLNDSSNFDLNKEFLDFQTIRAVEGASGAANVNIAGEANKVRNILGTQGLRGTQAAARGLESAANRVRATDTIDINRLVNNFLIQERPQDVEARRRGITQGQ